MYAKPEAMILQMILESSCILSLEQLGDLPEWRVASRWLGEQGYADPVHGPLPSPPLATREGTVPCQEIPVYPATTLNPPCSPLLLERKLERRQERTNQWPCVFTACLTVPLLRARGLRTSHSCERTTGEVSRQID